MGFPYYLTRKFQIKPVYLCFLTVLTQAQIKVKERLCQAEKPLHDQN